MFLIFSTLYFGTFAVVCCWASPLLPFITTHRLYYRYRHCCLLLVLMHILSIYFTRHYCCVCNAVDISDIIAMTVTYSCYLLTVYCCCYCCRRVDTCLQPWVNLSCNSIVNYKRLSFHRTQNLFIFIVRDDLSHITIITNVSGITLHNNE